MLNEKYMPMLHLKLKEGVSLPIDGKSVMYNDAFNYSNDTHVLPSVEYCAMYYGLCDTKKGVVSQVEYDYDLIPQNADKSNTVAVKGFNGKYLNMSTLDGEAIEGYALAGTMDGGFLDIYGSDARHEDDEDGTTVDLLVTAHTILNYFDVYSCTEYVGSNNN